MGGLGLRASARCTRCNFSGRALAGWGAGTEHGGEGEGGAPPPQTAIKGVLVCTVATESTGVVVRTDGGTRIGRRLQTS